jgi:hypothetical protein
MADSLEYTPPETWAWNKPSGGAFASINRPNAGLTHDKELPVGRQPLQLYSLGTPNGVKVTIMLEELLACGHSAAEYDAWLIKIGDGDQFSSGFVEVNPKSPIRMDALISLSCQSAGKAPDMGNKGPCCRTCQVTAQAWPGVLDHSPLVMRGRC